MSRIGRQPISIPTGVTVTIENGLISVSGAKGSLSRRLLPGIAVEQTAEQLLLTKTVDNPQTQQSYGLMRTLIANMINGVSKGFERVLEINGVGFRASVAGQSVNLSLGFSHPVAFRLPNGIAAKVEKNVITISGYDKQAVGQVAADLRALKPPEPYKGKGIKYIDEKIRRKAGKTAAKG